MQYTGSAFWQWTSCVGLYTVVTVPRGMEWLLLLDRSIVSRAGAVELLYRPPLTSSNSSNQLEPMAVPFSHGPIVYIRLPHFHLIFFN